MNCGSHRRESNDINLQVTYNLRCVGALLSITMYGSKVVPVNDSISSLVNCSFGRNIASGSLIGVLNSSMEMLLNSFIDNYFSMSQVIVHQDDNSMIISMRCNVC